MILQANLQDKNVWQNSQIMSKINQSMLFYYKEIMPIAINMDIAHEIADSASAEQHDGDKGDDQQLEHTGCMHWVSPIAPGVRSKRFPPGFPARHARSGHFRSFAV